MVARRKRGRYEESSLFRFGFAVSKVRSQLTSSITSDCFIRRDTSLSRLPFLISSESNESAKKDRLTSFEIQFLDSVEERSISSSLGTGRTLIPMSGPMARDDSWLAGLSVTVERTDGHQGSTFGHRRERGEEKLGEAKSGSTSARRAST